jgi:hypothetical protein
MEETRWIRARVKSLLGSCCKYFLEIQNRIFYISHHTMGIKNKKLASIYTSVVSILNPMALE